MQGQREFQRELKRMQRPRGREEADTFEEERGGPCGLRITKSLQDVLQEGQGLKVSEPPLWRVAPTDELWGAGTVTELFQVVSKMGKTVLRLPTGLVDVKASRKERSGGQVGVITIKDVD